MDDRKLLKKIHSGTEESIKSWREFLRLYTKLFLKIIWQFENEKDSVMDKYLYVCSKLYENNFAILRKFDINADSLPKLSTWLTVVVKNLCIESHRKSHGRNRLPKYFNNLDEYEKKVFQLYYVKGYSIFEIVEIIGNGHIPGVNEILEKINSFSSLKGKSPKDYNFLFSPLNDKLEDVNKTPEDILTAEEIDCWLSKSIEMLPEKEKLVLRLKFWEDLTIPEISDLMKIKPPRKVYSILEKGLGVLRHLASRDLEM